LSKCEISQKTSQGKKIRSIRALQIFAGQENLHKIAANIMGLGVRLIRKLSRDLPPDFLQSVAHG
jgi:hypothetical protein